MDINVKKTKTFVSNKSGHINSPIMYDKWICSRASLAVQVCGQLGPHSQNFYGKS